jgi:hypothetical protein
MRVEWNEIRNSDVVFVIAEYTSEGWEFFERSTWEVTWSRVATSSERVMRADARLWDNPDNVLPASRQLVRV